MTSIKADSVEHKRSDVTKQKNCGLEYDHFPTTECKSTSKSPPSSSDRILEGIVYNKPALLSADRDGLSNLHRIATYVSDPMLIDAIIKTLKNGNNFREDASRQNYLGHSPLFVSILTRNKTFAVKFLNARVPLNQRDSLGKTIFHYLAAKNSYFFTSEIFRESTFEPGEIAQALHAPDSEGLTATHVAYQAGNMVAFENFYRYGGVQLLRRNDQKRDYTLLHMAAEKGDIQMTEFLLTNKEFKMNVDVMGADEATPLHLAVSNGHVELARHLLELGADSTIPLRECSVLGLVPYECETEMRALFAQKVPQFYNFLSECSDNYYGDSSDDESS